MEKIADQIESLLTEKYNTYRDLSELFKKERKAIVEMDISSIWEAATQKKHIGEKIERLRTSIEPLMKKFFRFSVSNREKATFSSLNLAIDMEKAEMSRLASENQKYVQERLGIIENLVATILPLPEQERYGWTGSVMLPLKANCLINKAV